MWRHNTGSTQNTQRPATQDYSKKGFLEANPKETSGDTKLLHTTVAQRFGK